MTLFSCERLSAKISQESCRANKNRGVFACEKCAGLGGEVKIELEGKSMGSRPCNMKGCNKVESVDGFCTTHADPAKIAPRSQKRKDKRAAAKKVGSDSVNIRYEVLPVEHTKCATVTADEIRNIDYMAFLRQKYDERFDQSVSRLNKARTPYERAAFYLQECDAIIGLGC